MAMLGDGFNPNFTDFKEFRNSIEKIANEEASLDKRKILNENRGVTSQSNISIDFSNKIFLNLQTDEKVKSILYIDNQRATDMFFSKDEIILENLNRYHLYKCPTVDNIFGKNLKFSVVARDDNLFKYSFFNSGGELVYQTNDQQLLICKSCLTEFNLTHNSNYGDQNFYPSIYLQSVD